MKPTGSIAGGTRAAGFSSMLMLFGSMIRPRLCRLQACGSWSVGVGTLRTATVQSTPGAVTVAVAVAGSVSGILSSASDDASRSSALLLRLPVPILKPVPLTGLIVLVEALQGMGFKVEMKG